MSSLISWSLFCRLDSPRWNSNEQRLSWAEKQGKSKLIIAKTKGFGHPPSQPGLPNQPKLLHIVIKFYSHAFFDQNFRCVRPPLLPPKTYDWNHNKKKIGSVMINEAGSDSGTGLTFQASLDFVVSICLQLEVSYLFHLCSWWSFGLMGISFSCLFSQLILQPSQREKASFLLRQKIAAMKIREILNFICNSKIF